MYFSLSLIATCLLLIKSISSVTAFPPPSNTYLLGKAKRNTVEGVPADSTPNYPWVTKLAALKAGAIQDFEYEMEDDEFNDFLAISGFNVGDNITEVDADNEDSLSTDATSKVVPRKTKYCHNTVYKYFVIVTFRYKCGTYPKRKDCLPTVNGWDKKKREVIKYYPCGKKPPFHEPGHPERLLHFGSPGR